MKSWVDYITKVDGDTCPLAGGYSTLATGWR